MKNITSRKCGNCAELFKTKKLLDAHLKQCSKKEDEDEIVLLEDDDQELKSSEQQQTFFSNEHKEQEEEHENFEEVIEEDDGIEVVKSSIYKYQGTIEQHQLVNQNVFQYQYFDNYEDDDIEIIDETDEVEESSVDVFSENKIEEPRKDKCEECNQMIDPKEVTSHMNTIHPVQKSKMKQFDGGNFFMFVA